MLHYRFIKAHKGAFCEVNKIVEYQIGYGVYISAVCDDSVSQMCQTLIGDNLGVNKHLTFTL